MSAYLAYRGKLFNFICHIPQLVAADAAHRQIAWLSSLTEVSVSLYQNDLVKLDTNSTINLPAVRKHDLAIEPVMMELYKDRVKALFVFRIS